MRLDVSGDSELLAFFAVNLLGGPIEAEAASFFLMEI